MRLFPAIGAAAIILCAPSAVGFAAAPSDRDPAWSPDGKRIAFLSTRGRGEEELYVMNRNGSGLRRLTRDGRAKADVSWSPDGRWIAYTAAPGTIEEVTQDGRRRRRVLRCCAGQPDFSPVGGHEIVYRSQYAIWVLDFGGARRKVAEPESEDEALLAPTWSPTGRRIAFAAGVREHGDGVTPHLAIVARDGKRTKLLAGHSIWSTDWSPDGRRILIVESGAANEWRLAVLNLRTRKLRPLRRLRLGLYARWSPSGREILFADSGRIFVMDADRSRARVIVPRRGRTR